MHQRSGPPRKASRVSQHCSELFRSSRPAPIRHFHTVNTNPTTQVHLPRWERTLGAILIERLVFLPYLPHPEMLTMVANCGVMLDTFPWGAGVTAMEALFAGVPVVTLPARLSVLPLALGQVSHGCFSVAAAVLSGCFWPTLAGLHCGSLDRTERTCAVSTRSRSMTASDAFEENINISSKR